MALQTVTIPRVLGSTLIIQVNVQAQLAPPINVTWVTRDLKATFVTRDDKATFVTRDDSATWKARN